MAKPHGGDRHSGKIEAHGGFIRELIAEQGDMTLIEVQARLIERATFKGKDISARLKRDGVPLLLAAAGSAVNASTIAEVFVRMMRLRKIIGLEKPNVVVGFMHSSYVILAFALLGMRTPLIGSEHTVREYYHRHSFQYLLVTAGGIFLDKLTVLSIAPLLARAIREVFEDGSVTSLFDGHS